VNIFKFVFESRGLSNFARRSVQVVRRFGSGPRKMGKRFDRIMDVLDEFDVHPTFPITALPMSRNPSFAHRLLERGAELAVHAWTHTDLTSLDLALQSEHMGRAIQLFREHAVPYTGFRAPYLHWNDDTMRVVEDYKFRYSSNRTVFWNVIDEDSLQARQREGLERGRAFYRPVDADQMIVLPYRFRGFVEIPVSLPDDEILLDRMYMNDADYLGEVWGRILEESYRRGDLFALQLHPERIDFFADALRGMLGVARSKKPGIWVATLDQIAEWWVDKAVNRIDLVRDGGKFRADIKACPGATVYWREKSSERVVEPGTIAVDAGQGGERPCAGLLPGSDRKLIQRLTEMGYVVEVGDENEGYAVHLGRREDDDLETVLDCVAQLRACPGPLLRFGAWPHGNRSALAVTGDIDALTIWDFVHRLRGA
jgi:peptidoglycan/xylan/chitin deacetylase (PgdA/CDA1 family)